MEMALFACKTSPLPTANLPDLNLYRMTTMGHRLVRCALLQRPLAAHNWMRSPLLQLTKYEITHHQKVTGVRCTDTITILICLNNFLHHLTRKKIPFISLLLNSSKKLVLKLVLNQLVMPSMPNSNLIAPLKKTTSKALFECKKVWRKFRAANLLVYQRTLN